MQNHQEIEAFITYMFANKVCEHLLQPLQFINACMAQDYNNVYKKNPKTKIHFRNNEKSRTFVEDYSSILKTFHQIIQLQSLLIYTNFMRKEEKKINTFLYRHKLYERFDNS